MFYYMERLENMKRADKHVPCIKLREIMAFWIASCQFILHLLTERIHLVFTGNARFTSRVAITN